MSTGLEMALMVFAAWLVVCAGAWWILRWMLVSQRAERRDLVDRLQEMVGTIHHYQVAAHDPSPPGPSPGAFHYTEEQEDVLARTNELDREQLEAALAEAEFQGTEIELEP